MRGSEAGKLAARMTAPEALTPELIDAPPVLVQTDAMAARATEHTAAPAVKLGEQRVAPPVLDLRTANARLKETLADD